MLNLRFGPPISIQTAAGPRLMRIAPPTPEFWAEWKRAKDSLKERGISVKREHGIFQVRRFIEPDGETPAPAVAMGYEIANRFGLLPYQVPPAGALCASLVKLGSALDASDTGTGKSYVAVAVAREMALQPAIICPKSVIPAWQRVCTHFGITPLFVVNWEMLRSKKFPYGHYIEKERRYEWKVDPSRVLLVFDEAHKAKGEYTYNARAVIAAKGIFTVLLSATIAHSPNEMRALGYLLGLHSLEDFNLWRAARDCYQTETKVGLNWKCIDPVEQMKKLSADLFPARGARVRIADLPDFPESQVTAEAYPIDDTNRQNKAYQALLKEVEKLQGKKGAQAQLMVLNLRYRQLAENLKINLLYDMTLDHLENGLSVVVFTNFIDTMRALEIKLKIATTIHGQQTGAERQAAIDAFQADRRRVILVQIQAGGVGVSLHDLHGNHPRVTLIPPTYRAVELKQALGRVQRAGGKTKSIQRLIYAQGTIEEKVCQSVAGKLAAMSALNDGDLMEPDILGLAG